jgi:predicted hotdog family 3-hydroxylacyl-ACP dehydratase
MITKNQLPHIEEVLQHRGNMRLIDHLVAFNSEAIVAEYSPRSDAWYADDQGNMPAWIGIELMAQAVAAHVGMLKRAAEMPQKNGALVGTRRYSSAVSSFAAGLALQIQVAVVYQDASGLGAYDCSINCDGSALATATLKVFEPDDFQTFLQESLS